MNDLYHHTITIGNRAEILTALALHDQGYMVFTTICANSPVDLIALSHKGETIRIQVKYSKNMKVPRVNSWSDKNGHHSKIIDTSMFDYFALVFNDTVLFLPSEFAGRQIRNTLPDTDMKFWWWEDFLTLGERDIYAKKSRREVDPTISLSPAKQKKIDYMQNPTRCPNGSPKISYYVKKGRPTERLDLRRTIRPSREELLQMVWDKPFLQLSKELGVSDVAIKKWCMKMDIPVPGRGYWRKIEAGIIEKLPAPILVHSEGFEPITPSR